MASTVDWELARKVATRAGARKPFAHAGIHDPTLAAVATVQCLNVVDGLAFDGVEAIA